MPVCGGRRRVEETPQHTATHCNTLQHTATAHITPHALLQMLFSTGYVTERSEAWMMEFTTHTLPAVVN